MADLPAAVHLVAEPPVAHAVGFGMTVRPLEVRPVGAPGAVAVLDPRLGFVHGARAHVDADVRLGVEDAAVLEKFVRAEAVRLLRVPRELAPARPVRRRPDAVEPVIPAHEVPARPPEHGDPERADRVQHVPPEPARVAQGRALVVHAPVDAAAEVLDEVAEDPPVHGADPAGEVDRDPGHGAPFDDADRQRPQSRRAIPECQTNRRHGRAAESVERAGGVDARSPADYSRIQAAHADGELDPDPTRHAES